MALRMKDRCPQALKTSINRSRASTHGFIQRTREFLHPKDKPRVGDSSLKIRTQLLPLSQLDNTIRMGFESTYKVLSNPKAEPGGDQSKVGGYQAVQTL